MLSLSSVLSVDLVCCWNVSLAVILEGEVCVRVLCLGLCGVITVVEEYDFFLQGGWHLLCSRQSGRM